MSDLERVALIVAIVVGVIGLWKVFWRIFWPFMRLVVHLNEAMPVLLSVGEQFQANGGSTLKDQMNRIEVFMADRVAQNAAAQRKLDDLYDYSHDRSHVLANRLFIVEGRVDLLERRMNRVEHHNFGEHYTAPEFIEPRTVADGGLTPEEGGLA